VENFSDGSGTNDDAARAGSQRSGASQRPDWLGFVEGVRSGDEIALAKLTGLVRGLLVRLNALAVSESWDDICQEVLVRLVQSVETGRLREPLAFVGYAYTITRSRLYDAHRKRPAPLPEIDPVPEERSERELLLDLRRALKQLPPRQYRVLDEIYLRGRSYEETAQLLGLPLGTVKRHQTQGLHALREILGIDLAPASGADARPPAPRRGASAA
jgi:RNA polymerase sigma-70 factor, ECF subfamily